LCFEIAIKEVLTIGPQAGVDQAAKIMQDKNIGAIAVIENATLVDVIMERFL
jgi:CBS domain-containing protein